MRRGVLRGSTARSHLSSAHAHTALVPQRAVRKRDCRIVFGRVTLTEMITYSSYGWGESFASGEC